MSHPCLCSHAVEDHDGPTVRDAILAASRMPPDRPPSRCQHRACGCMIYRPDQRYAALLSIVSPSVGEPS